MNLYYSFVDSVSRHTLNISFIAWVLYSQSHDLVSSGGVFLGPTTNNITEYHAMTGLLTKDSSRDIDHMVVYLESQLVVS